MNKLRQFLYPRSVQTRVLLFFLSIFMGILLLLILPWGVYVQYSAQRDTKELARQQLEGLDASVQMSLNNRDSVVDILLLNRQFEIATAPGTPTLQWQRTLKDTLTRILINDLDLISATYFSHNGNYYTLASSYHIFAEHPEMLNSDLITQRVQEAKNGMTYLYNAGGALEITKNEEPFITFVRPINSLNNFEPLGVLMLNITSRRMGEVMAGQMGSGDSEVYLYDASHTVIAQTPNATANPETLEEFMQGGDETRILRLNGQSVVVCRYKSSLSDLSFLSITPLAGGTNLMQNSSFVLIVVALLAALVLIVSQMYISRSIGRPLAEMSRHMHLAEMGDFKPITPQNPDGKDEITQLQLFFNRMIAAIDALVERITEKEKLKRQHEIALLQEQIKPHFLYNALDAVSALSLLEDNNTAYALTQALSAFYRTSLSSGHQVVPLGVEVDCVRNYMTVLNIRYENKIEMEYDIDPGLEDEPLLKLVLQPLVENAVYHGIRQKKGAGKICVRCKLQQGQLVLAVADDGAGMTEERLADVLSGVSRKASRGFGVYSLREKLQLFYGDGARVDIESTPECGTCVTLHLPRLTPGQYTEEGIVQ